MNTSLFITNTDIVVDDTDSDTSSISTIDELNEYFQVNNNDSPKNKLKNKLVKPILSHTYFDKNKNEEVEDSYELVLFRFLHIFFSADGVIDFTHLTSHMNMNKQECRELEEFFLDNPGVMTDSDFYISDAGIKIRKLWYEFLSNRKFFTYVKENYQLFPDNKNFLVFINQFFPLINFNNESNDHEKLKVIYTHIQFDKKLQIIYSTYLKVENEFIHKSFIHNIHIDEIELFVLELTSITYTCNINKLYFTKTELRYAD